MEIGKGSVAATEGIRASIAALDALFLAEEALNAADSGGVDALQRAYEIRLERLALESTLEAQVAGLKARDGAEAFDMQEAMVPPDAPVQERTFNEISTIEEIAGILTTSSGAAAVFVTQSQRLCALPLAMDALTSGELSWQQAKIIADETEGLNHAGAAALVRTSWTLRPPTLPGVAGRGIGALAAPGEGPCLARTPPSRIHRKATCQICHRPAP